MDRLPELQWCEVCRESEWQPQMRGQLRAEGAGTEQPDGNAGARSRNGAQLLPRNGRFQQGQQLHHLSGKVIRAIRAAAKRTEGGCIRSGRTSQPEVDSPGKERL